MRRNICLLSAALVGLGMGGCTTVRYHDVKPLAQDFHQRSQESHTVLQRIQADLKAKRLLLHSLKRQGADMESQPYARLGSLLPGLQNQANACEAQRQEQANIQVDFEDLTRGLLRISSKSTEFKQIERLQDEAQTWMSKLRTCELEFRRASRQFEATASAGQIHQIDVQRSNAELTAFLRNLDTNISLLRSRASKLQAATLGKNRDTYRAITLKLVAIERERSEISKLVARFKQAAGAQEKLWVGPGLLSFTIMKQSHSRAQNIEEIGQAISQLAPTP